MAEDGAKDADIITSSVTQPHYCLGVQLVGNAQAWSKMGETGARVAAQIYSSFPGDAHFTSGEVDPASTVRPGGRFEAIDFPAQPRVDGQLGSQSNGVLPIKE